MTPFELLVNSVARLLNADEREAVLGDLAEAGTSPARTAAQLLGLITRRYAIAWLRVEPWIALLLAILPIALVLSLVTRWFSDEIAARVSWYVTAWFPGYFDNPGIRSELLGWIVATVAPVTVVLVGWSWSLGFTLARLCERTVVPAVLVFCVLLFAGTIGTTSTFARHTPPGSAFYTSTLATFVRVCFVLVPMLLGALNGRTKVPRWRLSLAIAAIGVVGLTLFTPYVEYALTFGRGVTPSPGMDNVVGTADDVRTFRPWVNLLVLWPFAYAAVVSTRSITAKDGSRYAQRLE